MLFVSLWLSSFLFVFLKAFQQRNVAFDDYIPVIPISIMMAAMEVYTITKVAAQGWHWGAVLVIGSASGTGAIVAMKLHKHFFGKS